MYRRSRYNIKTILLALAILFFITGNLSAQTEDTEIEESTSDESGDDALEAEEVGNEDTDAEEEEAEVESEEEAEVEEEDDDEAGDEELEESDDMELDFQALGAMDPEKDMDPNSDSTDGAVSSVSESFTARSIELFEVHGYFRVRPNLYHKIYIRNDPALFPINADQSAGCSQDDKCRTLAGADMRFAFNPTINLSEQVRINSEFLFFDNVLLGSNPTYPSNSGASTIAPGAALGYSQGGLSNDFFTMNRVWGEMDGTLGHLRFGRMPNHWGTGMLYNSGDGLDDDLGDTVDRISLSLKLNGWTIMPAFDFPSEGISLDSSHGRPFDVSQIDEAYRLVGVVAYQHEEEDQIALLKRGELVINTGLHFSYQVQAMSFEWDESDPTLENQIVATNRDMWAVIPDLWFQLYYDTFHLELELAFNIGEVGNPSNSSIEDDNTSIFGWGAVVQADYGLISDHLRIGLEMGIASGDKDVEGVSSPTSFDQPNNDASKHYSVFSFNPAYKVDLIMYRNILGSVAGTYYFNPWIRYDFIKEKLGKRIGAQLDIIYSRAIFEDSTISNSSNNLGIEIDATIDFVTADNFHASLQYGVLFPLTGFKGTYDWTDIEGQNEYTDDDLTIPQTLRLLLGITF